MRLVHTRLLFLTLSLVITSMLASAIGAAAAAPGTPQFEREWERTDRPVVNAGVQRSWVWGPEAISEVLDEPFSGVSGGTRQVQYFDKSRMLIDASGQVTSGMLVRDMIYGQVQVGDDVLEPRDPARVPVAGDPDSTRTPTYATLEALIASPKHAENATITRMLDAGGNVTTNPDLVMHGIIAQPTDTPEGYTIASIFWEFLTSEGVVYENGEYLQSSIFPEPWDLIGNPVTEAYWIDVTVAGADKVVLMQCFEMRCMTYTPDNPDGWRVEFGNVGQHYLAWLNEAQNELRGGILATFEVEDETFNIWVTNPETIEQILALESGASDANIPNGPLHRGAGLADHNAPWGWHYDPERVEMAEMTIELCDGAPWYVEENIDEYIEVVGSYCPWGAQLQNVVDYR